MATSELHRIVAQVRTRSQRARRLARLGRSRQAGQRRRPGRARLAALLVVAAAGAGFAVLGVAEAWSDAPTFDEPVYVSAGLAAVLRHDVTVNDEHPPLPKALAVLPVLLAHPVVPGGAVLRAGNERTYAARFLRDELAAGRLREVTFASRLVPLAVTVGTAFAVYGLAAELFGAGAGALGGVAWLASPFVLGIGHLDGTDVPFALAVTLSAWALARWLRLRTRGTLVSAGLAAGGAAAAEMSGLLVLAASLTVIAGVTWRLSGGRRALGRSALAAAAAWLVIWLPYVVLDPATAAHPAIVLPRPYVSGIGYLYASDRSPAPGYVAGVGYDGGRWWFWPVSLAVKYPAAVLALLVAGLVSWCWLERRVRRRALLAVALPALLLVAFTVPMPRDIGLRYLLPVLALWSAGAGALLQAAAAAPRLPRIAVRAGSAALLAAGAVATGASAPGSLAWAAAPFQPGYAAATNSDVDWGQGLYALAAWSARRHPWVSYFGPRGITTAQIPAARPLPPGAPAGVSGWVAVSATNLTSNDATRLGWLRAYCPVGTLADGTILLYHFASQPAAVAAGAVPARPSGVCSGEWSHVAGQPDNL